MRTPKTVSLKDAKRIVNILYPSLAQKSRQALPLIRSKLQAGGKEELKTNFPSDLKQLELDHGNFDRKPIEEATSLLPDKSVSVLSNVLEFKTRNQILHKSDFTKLAPIDESLFDWGLIKAKTRDFDLVQSRLPNLLPRGSYYLIFQNTSQAATYLLDTIGKELNGSNVYLQMINPKDHLPYISHNLLHESYSLDDSSNQLELKHLKSRKHFVIAKGIPTFIQKSTLKQMLWDFDLDYKNDPIVMLDHDPIAKIGMWLLAFENGLEALRYVRRFNGKHFNNESHLSKVYASVLS